MFPQRGSTTEAKCYGVPYSEHSSFRELTTFCCALDIVKIVPTVKFVIPSPSSCIIFYVKFSVFFKQVSDRCCELTYLGLNSIGNAKMREKMKVWFEKWAAEKKKNGFYHIEDDRETI